MKSADKKKKKMTLEELEAETKGVLKGKDKVSPQESLINDATQIWEQYDHFYLVLWSHVGHSSKNIVHAL